MSSEKTGRVRSVLQSVRDLIRRGKAEEALPLMEELIRRIEQTGPVTEDRTSEFRCFREYFEEALYRRYAQPQKQIRQPALPMAEVYGLYGRLLLELRRPEEADRALETALRWDPADTELAFARAEAAGAQGDTETFLARTLAVFRYAFRPRQLARCYRNLGTYFAGKEQWEAAAALQLLSLRYDRESVAAVQELIYIRRKSGIAVSGPDMALVERLARETGFPAGPAEEILALARAEGKRFAEKGDADGACYCWSIAYALTGDEEIQSLIDTLAQGDE